MPSITVPLTRSPPASERLHIAYTTRGTGPVLVLLIPGLCVPSSMYDDMSAVLAATTQFTTLAIDNRGIGASSVPAASLLRAPGYTAADLAADAWAVADHVVAARAATRTPLQPHVALVGHSMGGMVVQAMLSQRPKNVRFVALLSTHAGGLWNLLPTLSIIRSAARVAWSGFDRDVHASVNLSLHFTQRFLDDWIGTDVYPAQLNPPQLTDDKLLLTPTRFSPSPHASPRRSPAHTGSPAASAPALPSATPAEHTHDSQHPSQASTLRHRRGPNVAVSKTVEAKTPPGSSPPRASATPPTPSTPGAAHPSGASAASSPARHAGGPAINFFESKVLEFARDAQLYFGLSLATLPEALRHPRHVVLDALARQRQRRAHPRRSRRFDIYHARYTGQDVVRNASAPPSASAPALLQPCETAHEPAAEQKPDPAATHVLYGHVAVVRSHSLSRRFARRLRACSGLFKLVVAGRHDRVITPSATRALATAVGANTVVEVDAAHFVTDEAAAEVATHVVYGLRKAFFAPRSRACDCEWCEGEGEGGGDRDKSETGAETYPYESCRMC